MSQLTATKKEITLVSPYLGQQSFEIRNKIQCCLKKNAPVFNLKVFFQSRKQFSMLFPRFKDEINKMLHSNLVYNHKIDVNKTSESKECDICHYWYFLDKLFNL